MKPLEFVHVQIEDVLGETKKTLHKAVEHVWRVPGVQDFARIQPSTISSV